MQLNQVKIVERQEFKNDNQVQERCKYAYPKVCRACVARRRYVGLQCWPMRSAVKKVHATKQAKANSSVLKNGS